MLVSNSKGENQFTAILTHEKCPGANGRLKLRLKQTMLKIHRSSELERSALWLIGLAKAEVGESG